MTPIANRLKMFMIGLLLGTSFMVSCEAHPGENDPFCCTSYEDVSSIASTSDEFTNITQLMVNFLASPQLVTYPTDVNPVFNPTRNNPINPTLQISPGVGVCGDPIQISNGVCVPLCCSCCASASELTVLAMDSKTSADPNGNLPNLKPIHATDLHLCCGDQINSAFDGVSSYIAWNTDVTYGSLYHKADYFTSGAGQCQLVSGAQSPILPVRITARCSDPTPDNCNFEQLPPVNYPVRVFCAARSSEPEA
eukprot:972777_1